MLKNERLQFLSHRGCSIHSKSWAHSKCEHITPCTVATHTACGKWHRTRPLLVVTTLLSTTPTCSPLCITQWAHYIILPSHAHTCVRMHTWIKTTLTCNGHYSARPNLCDVLVVVWIKTTLTIIYACNGHYSKTQVSYVTTTAEHAARCSRPQPPRRGRSNLPPLCLPVLLAVAGR